MGDTSLSRVSSNAQNRVDKSLRQGKPPSRGERRAKHDSASRGTDSVGEDAGRGRPGARRVCVDRLADRSRLNRSADPGGNQHQRHSEQHRRQRLRRVDKQIGADATVVLRRPLLTTEGPHGQQGSASPLLSAPSRSGLTRAVERFFLAFLPPFLLIGLVVSRYALGKHLGFDYRPLWEASRHVLQGASPYPLPHAAALHDEQQFVYPPIAALFAAPLAAFPFGVAAALLAVVEVAATALTLRVLGVRDWRCYGVTLLWYPVIQNVLIGSITSVLALGLAIVWRYRDDRSVASPVTAALIATKVFLWPMLFWLAATRRGLVAARALA